MAFAYLIKDIDAYLLICERAQKNGKKPGDSMQQEFDEVAKEHPEWFELLGETNSDIDLLTGELRDKGLKVLNLKEIDRKEKNDNSKL